MTMRKFLNKNMVAFVVAVLLLAALRFEQRIPQRLLRC